MKKRVGIAVALCALVLVGSPVLAGGKAWKVPTCSSIKGIPSVSYTIDGGLSWAPGDGFLALGQGSFGMVTLDAQANTMLTEYGGTSLPPRRSGDWTRRRIPATV